MTREEIKNDILGLTNKCILAELPTSTGKTKIALDYINEKQLKGNILIVIPRLVLIDNWKDEIKKWEYENYLSQIIFTTYISLPKYTLQHYDVVIFDECHHLSERARLVAENIKSDYYLLLSATVNKQLKKDIKLLFPNIAFYKISMKEAINNEILPDPKVYLVPLELDNTLVSEKLIINPKVTNKIREIPFIDRFVARKDKTTKYICKCTQLQYYQDLSSLVEFYKKLYFQTNNKRWYFQWQQKAGERLKWLSGLKNEVILDILKVLKNKRTLTFCNSIAQTEALGKYCINSQNADSDKNLIMFNSKKIKHITACNILNEGVNLTDCQVGIFVNINSSETMITQKNGRILRHKNPMIIIVYYKYTREEELVTEMMKNYNPELITVVFNKKQLNEINSR